MSRGFRASTVSLSWRGAGAVHAAGVHFTQKGWGHGSGTASLSAVRDQVSADLGTLVVYTMPGAVGVKRRWTLCR